MYPGLSQEEMNDIHEAVAEAMGFVATDISLYKASPAVLDDLYREGSNGEDDWVLYATVKASVRFKPHEETLTRMGVNKIADILCFIPRQYILDWESSTSQTFEVSEAMELEWDGMRFNVNQTPRTDPLPMGNGAATDYIGMVVCGEEAKP